MADDETCEKWQWTYDTSFSERHGLSDPKKVEKLQNKVISSLKDHVTYNPEAQKKAQYFTRILDREEFNESQNVIKNKISSSTSKFPKLI